MLLDSWFGYLRGIYMFIKVFLLKYIPLCILCKKSRKEFFLNILQLKNFMIREILQNCDLNMNKNDSKLFY